MIKEINTLITENQGESWIECSERTSWGSAWDLENTKRPSCSENRMCRKALSFPEQLHLPSACLLLPSQQHVPSEHFLYDSHIKIGSQGRCETSSRNIYILTEVKTPDYHNGNKLCSKTSVSGIMCLVYFGVLGVGWKRLLWPPTLRPKRQ